MQRGAKLLGFSAMLLLSACGGEEGKLTIRSTGAPLSPDGKQMTSRVAEGRSQFALGNVALALDSFRKAVREEPGNIDAIIGVASCYDRMGRYDVSRTHYEAALAIEPANEHALAALAASLELQGKTREAAIVRNERRQRLADTRAASTTVPSEQALVTKSATIDLDSVVRSVVLADDGQLAHGATSATASIKPVKSATQALPRMAQRDVTSDAVAASNRTASTAQSTRAPKEPKQTFVEDLEDVAAPDSKVKPLVRSSSRPEAITINPGPRLERTSLAEVKLLTRDVQSSPVAQRGQRTAETSAIRFVPLQQAQGRVPIRVLNAARVERLAANTRLLISRHGWKNVAIGNATTVHARSVVLYPKSARPAAQRLATQLGIASALRAGRREVTVVLGSDAIALVSKRATSL